MSASVLRNVIQPKPVSVAPSRPSPSEEAADSQRPAEEMESVLSVLVENAPLCMAMFDRQMRYVLANRQWVQEFGLQAMQPLVGRSQYEVFPGLHPGWRQVYERALQGHVVRSEHDALAGPDGQRIVYRWEVRPWRRPKDASVGGLMVTCEKFGTTVPLELPSSEAAQQSAEAPSAGGVAECGLPMVLLDEGGVVRKANNAAVDLCLARGIQEGVSCFWDVFADGRDTNSLRQQTQAAMEKLSKPGAPKSQAVETAHDAAADGAASLPSRWLLSPAAESSGQRRFVALALPAAAVTPAPRPAPPLNAVANLPALANAVATIIQPSAADSVAASLETRRLQDDLARARQELRTLHEAERTFSQREGRVRQYLEALPLGVLVLDELGAPLFQNEQLSRLLGRPIGKEETVEQWLAAACPNEDHCREVTSIWRDDVWRRQLTRTFSLATADGLLKELEFHPVPLPRGGLLVSIQDATESCRHEEQLRATEAKFRTLLHEAPIPVVLMDKVGAVFEVNHLAEELFGHPKNELRRYPLDAWLDPDSGAARREAVQQMTADGRRGSELEVKIRQPGGQPAVSAKLHLAQVLDADGEPHSTVHFFQKHAPAAPAPAAPVSAPRAAAPVEEAPQAPVDRYLPLLTTNVNGRIRGWSERAAELFGISAEAAQGQPLHLHFRPSDATGFYAELARLARAPEESHELSCYNAQRERQTCRVHVVARGGGGHDFELNEWVQAPPPPAPDAEAPQDAASAVVEALGPQLEAAQRWPLADLSREKLLLSETHHRIKNHLQIISSLLNLESNTLTDHAARQALQSSQNRIRAIGELHQHLYQIALGTADSFAEFAEGLVRRLRECYQVPEERVAVDLALESGHIQQEWLMPLALTLNETLSNCLEHAFPDLRTGKIRATLTFDATGGCLTVTDNGVGLPVDFKPADAQGLGLKILAVFAEQMRGQFLISRPENGGTEIQLRFPIAFIDN